MCNVPAWSRTLNRRCPPTFPFLSNACAKHHARPEGDSTLHERFQLLSTSLQNMRDDVSSWELTVSADTISSRPPLSSVGYMCDFLPFFSFCLFVRHFASLLLPFSSIYIQRPLLCVRLHGSIGSDWASRPLRSQ